MHFRLSCCCFVVIVFFYCILQYCGYWVMSKICTKCSKTVYPLEELKCLDKVSWFLRRRTVTSCKVTAKYITGNQFCNSPSHLQELSLFCLHAYFLSVCYQVSIYDRRVTHTCCRVHTGPSATIPPPTHTQTKIIHYSAYNGDTRSRNMYQNS